MKIILPSILAAAVFLIAACAPASAQEQLAASKIPRLPDGKPDLSGLWDHPFVIDMSKDARGDNCGARMKGCSQKGPGGDLPFTPSAADWIKKFDPANFDATAHCNPMGYTRSMNAPVPTQIVQTPQQIVFLHESMFAFHVVYLDGRKHPTPEEAPETTWYGHSVGRWEGDTLVVDTVGPFFGSPRQLLDTRGHFMSDQLHVMERFQRLDGTHLGYEVTIDDPKAFTKPWKNVRTWVLMPPDEEVLEYVCTENNKEIEEHHIK